MKQHNEEKESFNKIYVIDLYKKLHEMVAEIECLIERLDTVEKDLYSMDIEENK